MNNKEILQKAKELVELLEKQERTGNVELSTLKRGEVFQTTGKRKYKVLEQYGDTTKIISLDLVKENVEFGDTSYYKTSKVRDIDVPYESSAIARADGLIVAYSVNYDSNKIVMGMYSTEEKAKKVMERLHNIYAEFTIANIVFRFPKDDEV